MTHPNRLRNTTILVFGGTSGIGLGVASMALSNGAHVTISGSTQPKVDTQVAHLQSLYPGSHVRGYACDLSDVANLEANIQAVLDKVVENGEGKKIDHIVHSAGDAVSMPGLADVTAAEALAGFHVRLLGGVFMGKLVASGRYMERSTASSVTLTSGTNTAKPLPGWTLGAAWGGAVEAAGRGMAIDLAPIRVNTVSPGAIHTPLLDKFIQKVGEEVSEGFKTKGSLLGTWGTPEDVAEAYGWFMKDRFVTGMVADSSGGRMLA